MTGFDFVPWTFAVGLMSLILITLNSKKMRQITFTFKTTSDGIQRMKNAPVGISIEVINTSDIPIKPLYIDGNVSICDKVFRLDTISVELEKGLPRYTFYKFKNGLESNGLISTEPTDAEIERILQTPIRLSLRYSYYRFHLMGKEFLKREKVYKLLWDQDLSLWSFA